MTVKELRECLKGYKGELPVIFATSPFTTYEILSVYEGDRQLVMDVEIKGLEELEKVHGVGTLGWMIKTLRKAGYHVS